MNSRRKSQNNNQSTGKNSGISVLGLTAVIAAGAAIVSTQGCANLQPNTIKAEKTTSDTLIFQQAKTHFLGQNYREAVPLLKYLAKRKNSDAQYALGYMHYYGIGVTRDQQVALTWMQLAAAKNNRRAQIALDRHRALASPDSSYRQSRQHA